MTPEDREAAMLEGQPMTQLTRADIERIRDEQTLRRFGSVRDLATTCLSVMDERDRAIAHDTQPYPTAWAYEQACAALRTAEAERESYRTLARERHEALHTAEARIEALTIEYDTYRAISVEEQADAEARAENAEADLRCGRERWSLLDQAQQTSKARIRALTFAAERVVDPNAGASTQAGAIYELERVLRALLSERDDFGKGVPPKTCGCPPDWGWGCPICAPLSPSERDDLEKGGTPDFSKKWTDYSFEHLAERDMEKGAAE